MFTEDCSTHCLPVLSWGGGVVHLNYQSEGVGFGQMLQVFFTPRYQECCGNPLPPPPPGMVKPTRKQGLMCRASQ